MTYVDWEDVPEDEKDSAVKFLEELDALYDMHLTDREDVEEISPEKD